MNDSMAFQDLLNPANFSLNWEQTLDGLFRSNGKGS